MTYPNFFIVGSPKAGTSAMAHYLSGHPKVFFSTPKEPFYWCQDFVESKSIHRLGCREDYLRLFESVDTRQHQIIAEGSTTYLQSRVAMSGIRAFNPNAKILTMLRNPVDVVAAMHGELLRHGMEVEENIETAWEMQASRLKGEGIPSNCKFPHQLQYRDVASFHDQVKRMMDAFPKDSCKIVFYEDFVSSTASVYAETLQFLGLSNDGRREFPKVHASKVVRNRWIARLSNDPPPWLGGVTGGLKNWYYGSTGPVKRMIQSALTRKQSRPPLSDVFRAKLTNEFRSDIESLGKLVDRDLSHWLAVPSLEAKSK